MALSQKVSSQNMHYGLEVSFFNMKGLSQGDYEKGLLQGDFIAMTIKLLLYKDPIFRQTHGGGMERL